ncbi:DUF7322 domain-containing protein [Halomarina pelagica]|uniref:DUF7322 domain-containing protein n=1 Tax=Halomarina pelagica TaxID=2961599 RepID=UPI0020C5038E|nr:hypothetical protein [Halomarina sp. BND7]
MNPFEEDEEDAWPDEPEEFDPESIGPRVEYAAPEDLADADVSDELFRAFWATVLMANVGLFAVSLGLMFVVFRAQYRLGGVVFGVGALALLFGYRYYRSYQDDRAERD